MSRRRNFTHKEARQLCTLLRERFYRCKAWRLTRRRALQLFGRKCHCCGSEGSRRYPLHVDHIKPRSYYPDLALDMRNLQVLCISCNSRKSNEHQNDYRPELHIECARLFENGMNVRAIITERERGNISPAEEKKRRLEQSQRDKKQNPKPKEKRKLLPLKERQKINRQNRKQHMLRQCAQVDFLERVTAARDCNKLHEFVNACYETIGVDDTVQMFRSCKKLHWLQGERSL